MPDYLKDWLRSLGNDQAKEMWAWLDSQPDAISQMISALLDPTPELIGDEKKFEVRVVNGPILAASRWEVAIDFTLKMLEKYPNITLEWYQDNEFYARFARETLARDDIEAEEQMEGAHFEPEAIQQDYERYVELMPGHPLKK